MVFEPNGNGRFGCLGGPAAGKPLGKGGARTTPPFGMGFTAAGAAQTKKIDDLRPAQKPCMLNPNG